MAEATALPPLLRGARRGLLGTLVLLGLAQAGLGMVLAWTVTRLQGSATGATTGWAIASLLFTVLAVGALRAHERVVAERLGQDYVREIRRALVEASLTPGDRSSLGVTVARTTNDLTAVRNWVAQGIAPLVVAVPLVAGVLVAFWALDWRLAVGALAPLVVLGAGVAAWARPAYEKSRALRRTRGRMAARIAETVTASDAILAAGGRRREVRNIDELSTRVVDHAVERAGTLGLLRSAGVVAATLMTLVAVVLEALGALAPGVVVAAMAIAGIAAAPLMDMGRVVEFRQSFLAARAVLDPALAQAQRRRDAARAHRERAARALPEGSVDADVQVRLAGLQDAPTTASAGDRVRLEGPRAVVEQAVTRLSGLAVPDGDDADVVRVAGRDLAAVPERTRRELIGVARAGTVFERGTVWRAARYRRPDLPDEEALRVLAAVGLGAEALPEGHATRLRQGGHALTADQRARLSLARALHGAPPLLVVDGIERDLDADGQDMLIRVLDAHPGVLVLAGCPRTADALDSRPVPLHAAPPAAAPTAPTTEEDTSE